jgi:type I restriction enzyme, R subunit
MPKAPEQEARARIDAQLAACGWAVQDLKKADFSASHGIAFREMRLKSGACDYLRISSSVPSSRACWMN